MRSAIITGSSSGLGFAIASAFVQSEFNVVLNGRNRDRLATAAAKLPSTRITKFEGDASEPSVIEGLFRAGREQFGTDVSAVVVNAGRGLNGSLLSCDISQLSELIQTNIIGTAALLRETGKRFMELRKSDKSTPLDIVVIGSISGSRISPWSSAYGATKAAVHSMTEALRRELCSLMIRVTLIEPAIVPSGFQDVSGYDAEWWKTVDEKYSPLISADDVGKTIQFIVNQPAHVHLSNIIIRSTRQELP